MPEPTIGHKITRVLIGKPKDPRDPGAFHKISLIALLAWVGLGADGLSSSAYGPAEAFQALDGHTGLAVFLALATGLTVLIISASYSQVIEQFPSGGGGYSVASRLLGEPVGVLAGSALLIDYVLTITISLAAGAEALCSFLPEPFNQWKIGIAYAGLALLLVLNLRGVKESVTTIAPVFGLFLITHAILFVAMLVEHLSDFGRVSHEVRSNLSATVSSLGLWGTLHLFGRAYALGAGTYTGIEAVSNGVAMMREPRVETAKRTMVLMGVSLAVTASAILVGYLLVGALPEPNKTMNAVLFEKVAGSWHIGGFEFGMAFVILALASEAALLFVAAQAGFIDGPRVMANMASDSWFPHRFSALSDRLTMRNGVLMMGAAAGGALLYATLATRGGDAAAGGGDESVVSKLVVMYAINVFVTFTLSNVGMSRLWISRRDKLPDWKRKLWIHLLAAVLCVVILAVMVFEKFFEGAWVTIVVTLGLMFLCFVIKRHYALVVRAVRRLDQELPGPEDLAPPGSSLPVAPAGGIDTKKPVVILFVGGYGGLGRHALLTCLRMFPGHFKGVVFASVAVVDTGAFKGEDQVEALIERTNDSLVAYERFANSLGLPAASALAVGTEVPDEAVKIGTEAIKEYPRGLVVAGQLVFEADTLWTHVLHNETAFLIQRRLQHVGVPMIVVPVKLDLEATKRDFPIVPRQRSVPGAD
jgi:amino acid transporter